MAVDIKNFIIERIKAQDPEIDVREGSGIYDLLINPLSSILTSYQADHTDIKNRQGITDISQLPRITRYLSSLRNGIGSKKYTDEEIKNILGGNSLRLLLDGWKNERK